ncbi:neuropilin and tolloid-like protein 2 isoform X2 [Crassostrea angulata]|uniref:neuropilin and tolloid-like protein 2 isoform X2 n=1 Tax=Magallana angulata TaxID=2784310 RepID=UPI0022B13ACB|nr:neuropilin and tolloid-like protein 2 isoform X2 [Crassostrea angulata]
MIFGLLVQTMMVASIGPPPELPMGDYHPPIKNSSDCHFAYSYKTDTKGMFASPGFPSEYPDSVTCSYFFHASASGRVQITFDFFSLEKPSDKGCTFDYLEIYYVNNNGFKDLIDRFCGTNTPKDFISHHPKMEILFVSDFTKHSNGFLAHYTFLGDNWHYFGPSTMGCGPEFLLGSGGIIQSPGYPSLARPRSSCTWIIIVEDTEKVLLTLVDLSSSNNQGTEEHLCGRSRLAFYNGFAVPGMLPERAYCAPMADVYYGKREYWSSSSRVVVRFETDIDGPMLSFKLSWTAVELVENDNCPRFLCKGEPCEDGDSQSCTSKLKVCIDKSLQCNDAPNCGYSDKSDEEKCVNKILMIVLYAAVPSVILILIIILVVYCYRRHKRKQLHIVKSTESVASPQTHWVSPHIRSLENSPVTNRSPLIHTTSFVTSKHSANPESSPKRDSKRVTIVDHIDMEEFKRSPERHSVNGGVQLHEAGRDRKHIVTPCSENNVKEVATRVHVDGALRTPPQHYRTHQKRPSYHLMQEFNMEGTDILQ